MTADAEFTNFVLGRLDTLDDFETKRMFGGTAVLKNGAAFVKIKKGSVWLKVDENNVDDFTNRGMPQYVYGKDNRRKLNFYETPPEVLEDKETFVKWAKKACSAALRSKSG